MEANPETIAVNDQAIAEQGASAAAFDRLLAQYRGSARSQREKGNLFEQLVRAYLRLDSQMRLQFARVYAWRDWPGAAGRPDTGIDLVAIEHRDMPSDGEVTPDTPAVAVQCKFYAPQTKIQKEHLDSFLSESGKEPFKRRIFVETTGVAWSQNAEAAIQGQSKPVTRIGLTDLRASNIDWKTYDFATPELSPTLQAHKRTLAHQTKAINDVMTGFETHDRGTLVMACGTGKTFTSLQIAQKFAERGDSAGARILFMVPSLALMSQTMHEWAAEVSVPFTAWSVCSDTKVNRKRADRDDIADIATMDLQIPPTTDAASLADSLTQARPNEGLQVVFATYQSIGVIHEAQVLAGEAWRDFDLVICDEAHRTTGAKLANEDESAFTRIHDNTYIRADKRLYMTATPRIFNPTTKKAAREKDAVLSSMDDQAIYGPVFHRLGFGQAVAGGLLTDYKVVVLQVPEDQITSIFQQGDEYGELSIPEAAKLVGCWNALAKRKNSFTDTQYGDDTNPMRRAVAFVKDIKTSKLVATEFQNLVNQHLQNLTNADPSDNLAVQCRHVDGTMNAVQRGEALDWLKADPGENYPVCRILTNARCLSEGVDVPTLDAVLFLNPRKSFVDVIQAVGRVMRRAPGKRFGYIILPVAIPAGIAPEEALNDNKRFEVVWQVLQAIRAHDERFDATINAIEYNESQPENIIVDVLNFQKPQHPEVIGSGGGCGSDSGEGDTTQTVGTGTDSGTGTATSFQQVMFPASQWKDAVYSKIVKKVGNRLYWDDWSKDIGKIAQRYISLIETLLQNEVNSDYFGQFVDALQKTLNPGVDRKQAIAMLAQHLITKPLFDAMFPDQEFTSQNPVSHAMQGILDRLAENRVFETEREPLEKFYQTMTEKIRAIDNLAGKQEIMRTLYDKFFSKAFPKLGNRLGIVFTPVPVVDYILHSAHEALVKHFGKGLGDEGVAIIEPFLGTGTFITRLLQSGLISPSQLEHKYRHEIFANEIVLLSYYIASINIEQVYREIRLEQGIDEGYVEFPGITLTDTFQLAERQNQIPCIGDFQANLKRVQAQRAAKIQVVVMNPPYSAGQKKANDNNQNLKYPWLDGRIADTYAARSSATNKNSLYDSYYRALRWATDRIGQEGVIAFVSNNSFIDGSTADGVRLTWVDEFSDIYVYNLRGNARTQDERRRQEAGNVFGEGSRTGVAITILVKKPHTDTARKRSARIHYAEVDDYLTAQEKLDVLSDETSITGTDQRGKFEAITPNSHGDWLNQRDDKYLEYQSLGEKKTKSKDYGQAIFRQYSRGLATSRDVWCYNYSHQAVTVNMSRMINNYNKEVAVGNTSDTANTDPTKISWNRQLFKDLDKHKIHEFKETAVQAAVYRPFCKQTVYFDRDMNDMVYQLPQIFPTQGHPNLAVVTDSDSVKSGAGLMVNYLPDLHVVGTSQAFSLYTWEKIDKNKPDGGFDLDALGDAPAEYAGDLDLSRPLEQQIPLRIDGYRRRENITDDTLKAYRKHYADLGITKEDIFFYIYALLHHPEYRQRFQADLKKMLPRIPHVPGFHDFAAIGRKLADLHIHYETAEPYPEVKEQWSLDAPTDPWQKYHIVKPAWSKQPSKRSKDHTTLVYNDYLTFTGIPREANAYKVGGSSPLGWVIDRYQIKTNKPSGITNDPNDYCRELNDPAYIARLIPSLVTVSMRTQSLITQLPKLQLDQVAID